jgi:hypothetical protein
MKPVHILAVAISLACSLVVHAECPLDHFIIGCNHDGIEGTADDRTLFLDSGQKYRNSGQTPYGNWFYPLQESIFAGYRYRIGEPGFDMFQAVNPGASITYDPNRSLAGEPDLDYRITIECVALSPGLRAVHKDYPQFTLDAAGQTFDHSAIHSLRGDSHIHMSYQATSGANLQWISFQIFDNLQDGEQYEPSEPVTLVFNVEPLPGDLVVDGKVGPADLAQLGRYWLSPESSRRNDFCERADTNRDGFVNMIDFARMAANWRTQMGD